MPRENDKEPIKEPNKDDPQKVVLRTSNDKSRPCPHCKELFNSQQALYYHLHQSTSPCVEKEAATADPPIVHAGPLGRNEIKPVTLNLDPALTMGEPDPIPLPPPPVHSADHADRENDPSLDGDSPPIPMFLVYIALAVLVGIGLIVIFWDFIWKQYQKVTGGEHLAGQPDQPPLQ